jgi:hypothetical protein
MRSTMGLNAQAIRTVSMSRLREEHGTKDGLQLQQQAIEIGLL